MLERAEKFNRLPSEMLDIGPPLLAFWFDEAVDLWHRWAKNRVEERHPYYQGSGRNRKPHSKGGQLVRSFEDALMIDRPQSKAEKDPELVMAQMQRLFGNIAKFERQQ